MMMKQCLVLMVVMYGALGLEDKYKTLLLQLHNDHRAKERSSNMNILVWDEQLEREAQDWADTCVYKHQMLERGENLAFDTAKSPETDLIKSAYKNWFDEKKLYTYGQHSCGPNSCHYSQLAWAETRRVGCGMKRCAKLEHAAKNAWYIACFYDPKGNQGGKPYERGTACNKCRDDQTCTDGLCSGGKDPCEDEHENCDIWANQMGQCTKNEKYMKQACKMSCGLCEGGKKPKPTEAVKVEIACENTHENCEGWAKIGRCESNSAYMNKYCNKACDTCPGGKQNANTKKTGGGGDGGGGGCKDIEANCSRWKLIGHCERNERYMEKFCKKSCKAC